jgi:hypothetical protein
MDAGRKIWLAAGIWRNGGLEIRDCFRAEDLPGSGKERDRSLNALQEFIGSEPRRAFGIDMPFGIPRFLVPETKWEEFILAFPGRYPNAGQFRKKCLADAKGAMIKRYTDLAEKTPWAPYHMRQFRQAYFGIRSVLHPLVRDKRACFLPLQNPRRDLPWVLEICPASTLKREGLYRPYKGKTETHGEQRRRILTALERSSPLTIPDRRIRNRILSDPGGDALDAVVAAYSVFRAFRSPASLLRTRHESCSMEGCVYP